MMKELTFDGDAKAKLLTGVKKLTKAVKSTLGPEGSPVVLDRGNTMPPVITKDGVSVAREIILEDRVENIGAQMVKNVSSKTNDVAGDGTTTATVLAEAIYQKGLTLAAAGMSEAKLKVGIDRATKYVLGYLETTCKEVTDEMLDEIATVSANGNAEMGATIAEAIRSVGTDGTVRTEQSKASNTYLTKIEGFEYEKGWMNPYFATNEDITEAVAEDARILCYDGTIDSATMLMPIVGAVAKTGKALAIVCDEIKGDALTFLVTNHLKGNIQIVPVKSPGYQGSKKAMLEDIAVITGATPITENCGITLDTAQLSHLGITPKIATSEMTTTIFGSVDKEIIEARAETVRGQLAKAKEDYAIFNLKIRLARLTTGIAIVNVGATNEIELKEKQDRIDDAINATQAALEKGVVPGGGTALLRAGQTCTTVTRHLDLGEAERAGVNILIEATQAPIRTIVENGNGTPDVIIRDILRNHDVNFGYDARKCEYVNMYDAGIIDPVKVTMTALENAASIAGLLLTTNCVVSLSPKIATQSKQTGDV